jgi:hypothetical protein
MHRLVIRFPKGAVLFVAMVTGENHQVAASMYGYSMISDLKDVFSRDDVTVLQI